MTRRDEVLENQQSLVRALRGSLPYLEEFHHQVFVVCVNNAHFLFSVEEQRTDEETPKEEANIKTEVEASSKTNLPSLKKLMTSF